MSDLKLHYVAMDYCDEELTLLVNAGNEERALDYFRVFYELEGRIDPLTPFTKLRRGQNLVRVFEASYDRDRPGVIDWDSTDISPETEAHFSIIGSCKIVYVGQFVEADE